MHTSMPLYMYYGMLCNVMEMHRDAQHDGYQLTYYIS